MRKLLLDIFTLAIALSLGTPAVLAGQHGNGHGNGNGNGNGHGNGNAEVHQDGNGNGNGNGHGHGNKHADDDHGWKKGDGYEYRSYAVPGQYPPGWSRGKKTGWGNCGLPPGQAKKYGCRVYTYEGRPYYYYQDEVGAIYVRRPLISIQGGITIAP